MFKNHVYSVYIIGSLTYDSIDVYEIRAIGWFTFRLNSFGIKHSSSLWMSLGFAKKKKFLVYRKCFPDTYRNQENAGYILERF